MDDVVKRLKLWEKVFPEDLDKEEGHLYQEAADRIEQLELELSISRMAQVVMDNTVEALTKADDRIDTLTAQLESTLRDRKLILEERDRTFALMLARVLKAEAEWRKYEAAWMTAEGKLADAEADNARLRGAMTGIKRAAAHRMQNDPKDLHSYYFYTADAALNTGKEPSHE